MARRFIDAHAFLCAVPKLDLDFDVAAAPRAPRFERWIVAAATRVFVRIHAREQRLNLRTPDCFVGERPQRVFAVERTGSERVLEAEFAFETGRGLVVRQDLHATGRHAAFETLDIARAETKLF